MNSNEYIRALEKKLKKVPEEDRADAIAYYREYFDEAGPERERAVIDGLGTPAQVAAGIKTDIAMRNLNEGAPKVKKGVSAIWITLLGVFALPIGLPIAVAVFAILLSLFIALLAVLISFGASAFAMVVGGLFTLITGVLIIPASANAALFYIGGGLAVLALGALLGVFTFWLSRVSLKGIAHRINRVRYNRAVKKNPDVNRMNQTDRAKAPKSTDTIDTTDTTGAVDTVETDDHKEIIQ